MGFISATFYRYRENKTISQLKPWTVMRGELPIGAVSAEVVAAPDRYTALSYTPPLEQPMLNAAQQRASQNFRKRELSGNASNPLKGIKPSLSS